MKSIRFEIFMTMLAVLLVGTVLPVRAATVTVDGTCDEAVFDAALAAANAGDTIAFNCNGGAAAVIDVTTQKTITTNITIDGANGAASPSQGGNVTIHNSSTTSRVFDMGADASLTLTNLTVIHTQNTNVNASMIQMGNGGTLTLNNSVVRDSTNNAYGVIRA